MNVDSLRIPLVWTGNPTPPVAGTPVLLHLWFRRATIYALDAAA